METPSFSDLLEHLRDLPGAAAIPPPPWDTPEPDNWANQYRVSWWWLRTFFVPGGHEYFVFYWAKHRVEAIAGFYVPDDAVREAARVLGFEITEDNYGYGRLRAMCAARAPDGERCRGDATAWRPVERQRFWFPTCRREHNDGGHWVHRSIFVQIAMVRAVLREQADSMES